MWQTEAGKPYKEPDIFFKERFSKSIHPGGHCIERSVRRKGDTCLLLCCIISGCSLPAGKPHAYFGKAKDMLERVSKRTASPAVCIWLREANDVIVSPTT